LVNVTTPLSRIEVTCDMSGLTSRVGTVLLSGLQSSLNLSRRLSRPLLRTASSPVPRSRMPLSAAGDAVEARRRPETSSAVLRAPFQGMLKPLPSRALGL